MKTKILAGILSLALGFSAVSCDDDDDYSPATGTLVQSVVTGSSDVTATSAVLKGTVDGLQTQAASAYTVGFFYGASAEALTETAAGSLDGNTISASLTGLTNNTTLYYQAYVTLQKTVTYKGEVKSLVTTNAKVSTADAKEIGVNSVVVGGTAVDYPTGATCGVVFAASSDVEKVRAGLKVAAGEVGAFSIEKKGLLPSATYYYAAYLDLGSGVVYGDVKEFETKEFSIDPDRDFVDLGLSTKWCKFNIGATKASELGGLFAFGDLTGLNNSTSCSDYTPAADIYKTDSDIAFKSLSKATMPTADEFEELFTKCKVEWAEEDGTAGYKFTGPNGNSIFMPAAGSRTGNAVSGEGVKGLYLTGSVNPSAPDFAISYAFSNGQNDKTTTPRYQALSVRPVTVAKNIPFNKALLEKKWVIDLNADGESFRFDGPLYYYGTDDSWATVTNNEGAYLGSIDSWNWIPKYSENEWLGPKADYGFMEFKGDSVHIYRGTPEFDEDGNYKSMTYTEEKGIYEVDEVNKTITLPFDVLGFGTFNKLTLDAKTKLKIFSLTDETLQIAILRDPGLSGEGAASLCYNYISNDVKQAEEAVKVKLIAAGSDWAGTWGTEVSKFSPLDLVAKGSITETVTYEGSMNGAKVFVIDFGGLCGKLPNSFVRIDGIKADGKDVKYDASKFCYGNIEGEDAGNNYRVEFFNAWGLTAKASPFSNTAEAIEDEMAVSFSDKVEITYTVFADANVARKYDVNLITVNPSWGGTWGYNAGQQIEVKYDEETHKFAFEPTTLSFSYSDASTDYSAGSIMTFLEVADIYGYFPGLHATLDKLVIDGKDITFDAAKVLDSNESPKYRLELWNCYGATKGNCAFGEADGDVIKELGFTDKMELTATFHSLFATPSFD